MKNDDLDHHNFQQHDLVVALVFWCISLAILIESWSLTFSLNLPGVETEKAWLVAPGIFPLALSICLLLMFSIVIWGAAKKTSLTGYLSTNKLLLLLGDRENIKHVMQILLLCVYVFGLIGRIHFGLASALYLCCAMFVSRAAKWPTVLIISITFSAAVTFLFGSAMKIPLP